MAGVLEFIYIVWFGGWYSLSLCLHFQKAFCPFQHVILPIDKDVYTTSDECLCPAWEFSYISFLRAFSAYVMRFIVLFRADIWGCKTIDYYFEKSFVSQDGYDCLFSFHICLLLIESMIDKNSQGPRHTWAPRIKNYLPNWIKEKNKYSHGLELCDLSKWPVILSCPHNPDRQQMLYFCIGSSFNWD